MEQTIEVKTFDAVAKAAAAAQEMAKRENLTGDFWQYIEAYDNATIIVTHDEGDDDMHLKIDVSDTVVMQRFGKLDLYK